LLEVRDEEEEDGCGDISTGEKRSEFDKEGVVRESLI